MEARILNINTQSNQVTEASKEDSGLTKTDNSKHLELAMALARNERTDESDGLNESMGDVNENLHTNDNYI